MRGGLREVCGTTAAKILVSMHVFFWLAAFFRLKVPQITTNQTTKVLIMRPTNHIFYLNEKVNRVRSTHTRRINMALNHWW
jgi:hypothetical protein